MHPSWHPLRPTSARLAHCACRFTHPPAFSAHLTQHESQEQHATVQAFANALSHLAGNGWLQVCVCVRARSPPLAPYSVCALGRHICALQGLRSQGQGCGTGTLHACAASICLMPEGQPQGG